MRESKGNEGSGLAIAFVLLMLLLLMGGGAGYIFWQRQQAQRLRAAAELASARQAAQAAADRTVIPKGLNTQSAASDTDDSAPQQQTEQALLAVLSAQSEAWNEGDLDAFMEFYWHSDQLTFSSSGNTTRGWLSTLQRYRDKYPSQAEMGTLRFYELEVMPLGSAAALVLGEWHLTRADEEDTAGKDSTAGKDNTAGELRGNFSLVFRRIDGRWLIIHDHTSLRSN